MYMKNIDEEDQCESNICKDFGIFLFHITIDVCVIGLPILALDNYLFSY
jgi:hypothetical protein